MAKATKRKTAKASVKTDAHGNDQLADLVARQLPGWTIDPEMLSTVDALHMNERTKSATGASLADLERKFPIKKQSASASKKTAPYKTAEVKSSSLRIKPDDGGPSKVADVVDGYIKIVQG